LFLYLYIYFSIWSIRVLSWLLRCSAFEHKISVRPPLLSKFYVIFTRFSCRVRIKVTAGKYYTLDSGRLYSVGFCQKFYTQLEVPEHILGKRIKFNSTVTKNAISLGLNIFGGCNCYSFSNNS